MLKNMYERASEARIDACRTRFQGLRMKPTENVMEYINRLRILQNRLVSAGRLTCSDVPFEDYETSSVFPCKSYGQQKLDMKKLYET